MGTVLIVGASTPALKAMDNNKEATYIVVFNDGAQVSVMEDQVTAFVSENNGKVLYNYDTINGMAVQVPAGAEGKLKSLKNVKYVEKEITFHANLDVATGIVGTPLAWASQYTGKGVKVAVVDSGIDGGHPDLKGKIVGWKDFVNNKESAYDDMGHGSHCSGIIAGTGAGSNGKYKGVAPEASLIGVKVLGKDGSGSSSDILAGIEWAANSGAKIISMSLGSDEHSQAMDDAVSKAVKKGVIVIVAAGNSGPRSGTIGCPSDCPDALTVGATDKSDNIASFSSRGPTKDGRQKPEIAAPGKDIVSARATGIHDEKAVSSYYISMSGTSMACPMVSGAVALLVQKDPSLTPEKVKEILTKTADQFGSKVPNYDYGYGRMNITAAIDYMNGNFTPKPTPSPTPMPTPSPTPTPNPGQPGYPNPGQPGYPYPGYPYPGYPYPGNPGNPTPTPTPNPGEPGCPYPGNPGYNPGYPYPGNPYPDNPGYYPGYPYPGYYGN